MQIYILSDQFGEVRYIGKTNFALEKRLEEHLSKSCLSFNTHKNNWIKSLLNKNIKPNIQSIAFAHNEEELNAMEIYWIKFFKEQGYRLVNGTNGGDGVSGHKHSKETLRRLSDSHKGIKNTPEQRAKISMALKGRKKPPRTPEHIEKIAATKRGKKQSLEHVAKRIVRLTGMKYKSKAPHAQ